MTAQRLGLNLVALSFEEVAFAAEINGRERAVSVLVGSGNSWSAACLFPNVRSEAGESLGDDLLDAQIRRRAGEELARLAGTVAALQEAA
jgi:hypothetical protein